MLTAINNGERVFPEYGIIAQCPECGENVIPVLGSINVHHWRHQVDCGCDFQAGETEWHRNLKSLFHKNFIEVGKGEHRADILLPNGTCIEFQNSAISEEDIIRRSANYKRIIWLFNIAKQNINGQVDDWVDENSKWNIKYIRPHQYFNKCMPNLFFDLGQSGLLLKVTAMYYGFEFNKRTGYNERFLRAVGDCIHRDEEFPDITHAIDGSKRNVIIDNSIQLSIF